jgi:hypothetical protein
MPKLPGFESLGGVQTDATRPVGNYDVSPLARGGQAIAQGVETLGKGVQTAATDVAQVQIYRERNQALLAQDQALGEAISLREKYQPGGDKYTSDPDALTNSYQTDLDAIAAKHLNTIPAGALREHAAARLQIPFAHEVVSVAAEARKRQIGDFRSGLMNEADQLINTTGPTDDPLHTAQMQQWGTKVQLGKEQGFLTPGEAEELQKKTPEA